MQPESAPNFPNDNNQQNRTDQRKEREKGIRRLLRAIFGDGH